MVKAITQTKRMPVPWMSFIGIPVTGLSWSLAILWVNREELATMGFQPTQAFMLISLGSLVQTTALWAGFTAVIWAMVKAFGGHIPLARLLSLMSSATLPLWAGAPAAACWLHSGKPASSWALPVFTLALCAFLYSTAHLLTRTLDWPHWRSLGTTIMAAIFLSSFTFLTH